MTAPFSKIVNEKHDQKVLAEQQDQVIRMANSRRKETPAKKANWIPELVLAMAFIIAMAVAVYMATASHCGAPSFGGTPVSEMSISEQLDAVKEARYND